MLDDSLYGDAGQRHARRRRRGRLPRLRHRHRHAQGRRRRGQPLPGRRQRHGRRRRRRRLPRRRRSTATGSRLVRRRPGFDRLYLGSRNADLTIELDNQADDGEAGENDNIRADIERIDLGAGNDTINIATGAANTAAADNEVYGGGGNDTIKTGPGEDYVEGGLGNDTITGGEGEDRAFGLAGADRFLMMDGFFDHVDGGAGDGVNDTGQFDSFDERLNFP